MKTTIRILLVLFFGYMTTGAIVRGIYYNDLMQNDILHYEDAQIRLSVMIMLGLFFGLLTVLYVTKLIKIDK